MESVTFHQTLARNLVVRQLVAQKGTDLKKEKNSLSPFQK
jgi:hypothetical protein